MNYKLVLKMIGRILRLEALALLVPAVVSAFYGYDQCAVFLYSSLITFICGQFLYSLKPSRPKLAHKEAYAVAAAAWIALSLFGALPLIFSGCFGSVLDCVFEAISGFTTTGASTAANAGALPMAVTLWRAMTQWFGGLGIVALMVALTPATKTSASSVNLFKAESASVDSERIAPRVRETARILYTIYIGMTVLLLSILLITGMGLFDSFVYAMGTVATGGSATHTGEPNGIAAVGLMARVPIVAFMFLCGVNFQVIYRAVKGKFKDVVRNEELRGYTLIAAGAAALIAAALLPYYGNAKQAIGYAVFHTVSFMSTTGYYIADYTSWPAGARLVLLILALVGGCAGSTSCGMKIARVRLLFKAVRNELNKIIRPRVVKPILMNGVKLNDGIMIQVLLFFAAYSLILGLTAIIIAFDTNSLSAAFSYAVSMISNVGFSVMGPSEGFSGFSAFSPLSKLMMSFCMLAGRLEFYPVFVLFMPSMWKANA